MSDSTSSASAVSGRRFWQLPRREFFIGGLAGLILGKGSGWARAKEPTLSSLPKGTRFYFSQHGEDIVVNGLFCARKIEKPSYLDIGAWEPIDSNNTYHFYLQGGRGVLVEPNPAYTEKLKQARPGDVVLQAGIGIDETTELDFYMLDDDQLNTFDRKQVDHVVATLGKKLERVVKMPLLNINRVMAEHFKGSAPDFLSIDVEGLDLAILKTLDFERFRPKVICVETVITGTMRHNPETPEFLATKGYIVSGGTYPNTVLLDKKLLD